MEKKLVSILIERSCLAAIIQFPDIIPETSTFIKREHFSDEKYHGTIYSLCLIIYKEMGDLDSVILTERLISLGLDKIEGISMIDYIESISSTPIKKSSFKYYFSELYKYFYLRQQIVSLDEAKKEILNNVDQTLSEIVKKTEKILSESSTINVEDDYKPTDLFGEMVQFIEDKAENPKEIGLITPYPIFNKKYVGLPFGDLYVVAAPPKMGKSTFLTYTAYGCSKIGLNNCKVFYADTELEGARVMARLASSLSGVGEYFIKTGKFKKDINTYNKIKNSIYPECKALSGKISHFYVENKPIDDVLAIFKRWYYTNVKEGENVLFIYDYLKLTGEKTSDHWKEYQIMGEKTDKIKKVVSSYPNTAGLVAVQINRMGDIAMASQIEWFASNIYKLLPKTLEEVSEHGKNFGTHKLIPHRTRIQGEDATGFSNHINIMENGQKVTIENFINLNIDHFKVEEKGTLEDVIKSNAGQLSLKDVDENEDFQSGKYPIPKDLF